jgi:hypothetical protein
MGTLCGGIYDYETWDINAGKLLYTYFTTIHNNIIYLINISANQKGKKEILQNIKKIIKRRYLFMTYMLD